jgi:hypothetical protein
MAFSSNTDFKKIARRAAVRLAGFTAAQDGLLPSANPHKRAECGMRSVWNAGWWEAENIMAVAERRNVRTIDGTCCLIGDNIQRQKGFKKQNKKEQ